MNFYFRIDNLDYQDTFFNSSTDEIIELIFEFYKEKKEYGDAIDSFASVIVLRNQKYYKLIEEDPSQYKVYQYYPNVIYKRKNKMLMSFVEIHHDEVKNAKTKTSCIKIVAKAILKSIENANEFAKPNQKIDFNKMKVELILFFALKGIPFS